MYKHNIEALSRNQFSYQILRHGVRFLIYLLIYLFTYLLIYLLTYVLTYLVTYLLVPWSRVRLEKLTGSQLVKKLPAFYGTRRFTTALTRVRHLSLSRAILL